MVFDLDGTLIDSQYDLAFSVNQVRKEFGLDILEVPVIRSFVGDGVKMLLQRALPDIDLKQLDEAAESFRAVYLKHLTDTTKLYPGIMDFLSSTPDVKKAIVTNKSQLFSTEILKNLKIYQYFSDIIGGDSGIERKPHPEALLSLLNKYSSGHSSMLMIGDSKNDILSARASGIRSAAVGYGYTKPEELKLWGPDYLLDTPKDLFKFV